jgi:hypothetical protein
MTDASWTAGGTMGTARGGSGGAGTQTAALIFGGNPPPAGFNNTEEYDGNSWTAGGTMNVARSLMGSFGIQTLAIAAGGFNSPGTPGVNNVEEYNGATWTASPATISTARSHSKGGGTNSAGIIFGGRKIGTPTFSAATEEWTEAGAAVTKTITVS